MNSDEKSTRTFEGPSAHSHTQIEMNNRTLWAKKNNPNETHC